jgi:hypothetical protein
MTRKTVITYSMLFLFAFTFAFAFTLASSARADDDNWCLQCVCCVEYCEGYPTYVSVVGHWEKINPLGNCDPDNIYCSGEASRCSPAPCKDHFTYLCPD